MSENWDDYESGPFCRHWSDPSECDECRAGCATCGHSGLDHDFNKPGACNECHCEAWVEPQITPPSQQEPT